MTRTPPAFEEGADVVLGGEGLIGRRLVDRLRGMGGKVASLDLKTGFDLRALRRDELTGAGRVWFLAWDTGGAAFLEDPRRQVEQLEHNVALCQAVFNAIERCGAPFMFISSQLAGADHAYGVTKRLGQFWASELGGNVARLWNVYGWEDPSERTHLVTDLITGALADGVVRCRTTGGEVRRLLHVDDCVTGLITLMEAEQKGADLAGERWHSVSDVAQEIAKQLSVPWELGSAIGSEFRVDPMTGLDGWSPSITLSEGIAETIACARASAAAEPAGRAEGWPR
jgi:nucleoside-diphosphate-sugar epimerase